MKIYVPRDRELVCLHVSVCKGERASQSECVWQWFTTAAAFTQADTGEGHPEQNGAYANVPQLWPSARQTGLLPGNKLLRSPGPYGTRRICLDHA